jgi:hypothetical protein
MVFSIKKTPQDLYNACGVLKLIFVINRLWENT